jgi:hypothetical protein
MQSEITKEENMRNNKKFVKEMVDILTAENEVEPLTLARRLNEQWEKFSKIRVFTSRPPAFAKGFYYFFMQEVFQRCQTGNLSFSDWIENNNLEIA